MEQTEHDAQDVLTREILQDAQRQQRRAVSASKQKALVLLSKSRKDVDRDRSEKLAEARAEADRLRERTRATIPAELNRIRSKRIEDQLQWVHDRALEQLQRREDIDTREILLTLVAQAIDHMPGTQFIVELSPADLDLAGPDFADHALQRITRKEVSLSVSEQPANITGGAVVRDVDGRQVWDNSYEGRLQRLWPGLRTEIAVETSLVKQADTTQRTVPE